jgi:fibroblast growth factor receptor 4
MWWSTVQGFVWFLLCACALANKVKKRNIQPIDSAPRWAEGMVFQPHIIVPENNIIRLMCPADGQPKPSIRWLKENVFVDSIPSISGRLESKELISHPSNWTLTLLEVHPRMSGNYTCIVGNQYGKLRWTFIVEIIRREPHPPIIRKKPESQTIVEGSSVTLECRVLSDLPLEIKWMWHYKVNGSFIDKRGKPYLQVLKHRNITEYGDMWGQTLYLRRVRVSDTGWYTCIVSNLFGSKHASAWLQVISKTEARMRAQKSSAPQLATDYHRTTQGLHRTILLFICLFLSVMSS